MKMLLRFSVFIQVSFILFSCDPPRVDMSKLEEEKIRHKIVKASDADILFEASTYGEYLVSLAEKNGTELQDSLYTKKIAVFTFLSKLDEATTDKQKLYFESMLGAVESGVVPSSVPEFTEGKKKVLYVSPMVDGEVFKGMYFVELNAKHILMHMNTKLD